MALQKSPLAALLVGAMLAMPLAAMAQAPANTAQTPGTKAESGVKPPPVTAPVKPENVKQGAPVTDAPPATSPPKPNAGSTAVPGWNNPPQWGGVSERPQYASVPGREYNVLIQGAGREWRAFRNGPLTQIGGWLLVGVLALIIIFYLIKGPIRLHGQPTGRLIERFNAVERAAHWTTAITFVALAITGIVMFFGKHIILPWLGYGAFSWLSIVSKNLHNFVGPLFMFAILVTFLLYVRDNLITAADMVWMKSFGGMFSGREVPSGRFNGLEKAWFWGGLVLLGIVMSVTGLILDFPNWNQTREAMQQANVIHIIAGVLFIAASLGHIYMGTIGMQGAYRAMRDGYVDETWAREHHSLWYDEVRAGKRPEKIVAGEPQPVTGD
jgi:formate dehydrogenase subunit gamma